MKFNLIKSDDRGGADYGWLKTKYSYSFSNYYDPNRIHFGALRVVNDDIIQGGMGFGKHPHDNMEIITIPTKGALKHGDSLGNGSVIEAGDVQVMSAGTGIYHSEMNALSKEETRLFQIWIIPNKKDVEPRYQQVSLQNLFKENELYQIVSPNKEANGVWIHQDAWIYLGDFTKEQEVTYTINKEGNGIFLMVVEGEIIFDNKIIKERDTLEIEEIDKIDFKVNANTKILLIEVPLNF